MKKTNLLIIGLGLFIPAMVQGQAPAPPQRGVTGSVHDFSQETWNTRRGVCSPCHAAHHTDPAQIVPLWNHATTEATFIPYASDTLNASIGDPSGPSLACLSCHDGTVAINQLHGGLTGSTAVYIDEGAQIGPDLHNTHPISFTYDSALAVDDGGLADPATFTIGSSHPNYAGPPVPATGFTGTDLTGKTIQDALMDGGTTMECSSCHDVHKQDGSAPSSGILLKISGNDSANSGSLICRTCHIK